MLDTSGLTNHSQLVARSALTTDRRKLAVFIGATLFLLTAGLYGSRLNLVVGLVGDDAWYGVLGQSLATGQGMQLISSPVPGILPTYPPAFPLLLAVFLRWLPFTAENLWWLKLLSITAMWGIGVATYRYCRLVCQLPQPIATTIAVITTWMPAFVFLATSTLMSECVFTLAQLLTVIVAEKALQKADQPTAWRWWVGAGLLASWVFLTRSIAISLLVAVVLYLLKARRWQAIVIFTGTTVLFIAPWMWYSRAHATPAELKRLHGGNVVFTYGDQMWMKRAAMLSSGTETVQDLPARFWRNMQNMAVRDWCGMLFPALLRRPQESGEETFSLGVSDAIGGGNMEGGTTTAIVSTTLFLLTLLGFITIARRRITLAEILLPCSLGIILLWPWWTFRFVIPLAPFLLHYLLIGLVTFAQFLSQYLRRPSLNDQWALPRIVFGCILALYGYDHLSYIHTQMRGPEVNAWISEYHESTAVLEWMRTHLPPDAIVAASNPARVFLHSGHKGVACDKPLQNWEAWKQIGVRYLVVLQSHGMTALDGQEKVFPVLHRSPNNMRVIDLGPSAHRPIPGQ